MRLKKKELEQDFELNLASIIDCFTVLITYLLMGASFISLGVFNITVAATSSDSSAPAPEVPKLSATVKLLGNQDILLKLTGPPETAGSQLVVKKDGQFDFETLVQNLKTIKSTHQEVDPLMITAEDSVSYVHLAKLIDLARNDFPHIAITAEPPGEK